VIDSVHTLLIIMSCGDPPYLTGTHCSNATIKLPQVTVAKSISIPAITALQYFKSNTMCENKSYSCAAPPVQTYRMITTGPTPSFSIYLLT
jgi:hypothetical protein